MKTRLSLLFLTVLSTLLCSIATNAQVVPSQALPKVDQYGCLLNVTTSVTGYWYTHKFGNKWLLVDPEGHGCFARGVFILDPTVSGITSVLTTKYGDANKTAIPAETRKLRDWGFNALDQPTVNAWPGQTNASWPDTVQPNPLLLIWDVPLNSYSTRYAGYTCPDHNKDLMRGMSYVATSGFVYFGGEDHDPYDVCWNDYLNGVLVDASAFGGSPLDIPDAAADLRTMGFALAEEDTCYGIVKPTHEHLSAMVLAASPFQTWNDHYAFDYTVDRVYHSKQQFLTFMQGRYASIGALNTAWGSSYDQFATHATNTVGTCGTGDGTTLTFSCTLSFVPDQDSLWLKVGASVVAGEYTNWGITITPALCLGGSVPNAIVSTISSCTVNHTTKAFSVTFTGGHAPGNGVLVTVDYYHGGWPKLVSGSAGFMDEDGSSAWMPNSGTNWTTLGNTTAAFQADMNAFLLAYATQFFKVVHDDFKAVYPNSLLMTINVMDMQGQTNPPFRKEVLQALAGNVDIIPMIYVYADGNDQTRLDYLAQYAGDIPILDGFYEQANLDSGQSAFGVNGYLGLQNDKGANYATLMDSIYSGTTNVAVANSQPGIGTRIWQMWDDSTQGNWGLFSVLDNAYDGRESTVPKCVDSWGTACGGESTKARSGYSIGTGTGAQTVYNATIKYLPILPGTFTVYNGTFTSTPQASDAFGRADANPLSGNWTKSTSFFDLQLASNHVESTSTSGASAAYYNGVTWSNFNDQSSTITIGAIGGSGFLASLARWQSASASGYQCRIGHPLGVSTPVSIVRTDFASDVLLASGTANASAGQTVECDALGSAITMQVNGSVVLTTTDSTYATGNAGMMVFDNSGSLTGTYITTWSGSSLSATAVCTDNGTSGTLSGSGCSGTINNNTGALAVTFNSPPTNGAALTGNFTSNGWGGFQPSYIPSVFAEHSKILHQIEAANFSLPTDTNLARYKPVSASSFLLLAGSGNNNYVPTRANDGLTATTWRPVASNPQWVRIDMLGKPSVSKAILRWGAVYATTYTLDWSDDGTSWTTVFTQAAGAGGVETDTFTAVSHRYWRMNETTRSGAGSLVLQELELYAQ